MEFLFLYWTYPTVVDIQVSVPSEIQVPGITFCSSNGIRPEAICSLGNFCLNSTILTAANYCSLFPVVCIEKGNVPDDFEAVIYNTFATSQNFDASVMNMLRKPLSEFFKCKITSGKSYRSCNTDDYVVGSYFSSTNIFNFCFTINSLWSQPNKEILKIRKSEKIEMEFYVDISDRLKDIDKRNLQPPKYSYSNMPSVQLVTHSSFVTASPFVFGHEFLAGKDYKIKLKQEERHLLPPPYQTNCTNYMNDWIARNGIAPLNERMVIEECKYMSSLKEMNCVPFSIDYPHNETVCKYCEKCSS
ncbi:uncharacterized protein TNCT_468331 [Trichonephila clavata]|uniref:Uncharacterized protein n=1 Tax=Trichonephila clavata TaxID=2740835 RepID=A0A8X6GX37_TRICU|nr:uncharacterized protein TNCT_468331 [Trichonephila clavata]